MTGVQSWMREAVDVMRIGKQGRPVAKLIRLCGTCGSTIAETAAVLDVTVEDLQDVIADKATLHNDHLDRLTAYWFALWWWHCWRLGRVEAHRRETIVEAFQQIFFHDIYDAVPQRLRDDWREAHQKATKGPINEWERKMSLSIKTIPDQKV